MFYSAGSGHTQSCLVSVYVCGLCMYVYVCMYVHKPSVCLSLSMLASSHDLLQRPKI
jgi:hypothetical protein